MHYKIIKIKCSHCNSNDIKKTAKRQMENKIITANNVPSNLSQTMPITDAGRE